MNLENQAGGCSELPTTISRLSALSIPCIPAARLQAIANTGRRVLFIGNSHTFVNDLPGMFAKLTSSGGCGVKVESSAMGGYTLEQHRWDRHTRKKLDEAEWDFVVLQENIWIAPIESKRNIQVALAIGALDEQIRSRGAKTVLMLMWASIMAVDQRGLAYFRSEQTRTTIVLQHLACELQIRIAPIGPAWDTALRLWPQMDLWGSDHYHASRAGTYLMACVLYASLYGKSPVGLRYDADLPDETVLFLQEIAEGVTERELSY
jgi:hypothetical protein